MKNVSGAAILLKLSDYNENDKMARLLTQAEGKVNAVFKGVKKSRAKLKLAAMPFCFGNFELVKDKGPFIVSGCEIIDSFYDITKDYDKYQYGAKLLAATDAATRFDTPAPEYLVHLLKFLRLLVYEEGINPQVLYLKFLLQLLTLQGYSLNFQNSCSICKTSSMGHTKFDFDSGGVVCGGCAPMTAEQIAPFCQSCLRIIGDTQNDRLFSLSFGGNLLPAQTLLESLIF